jgi:hypothetical protein
MSDVEGFKCDATGCTKDAVDCTWETVETPAWRRPAVAVTGEHCFECTRKVYWCAEHRAVVNDYLASIRP